MLEMHIYQAELQAVMHCMTWQKPKKAHKPDSEVKAYVTQAIRLHNYQAELFSMMRSLAQSTPKTIATPEIIMKAVCEALSLRKIEVMSKSQKRELTEARFIAMALMDEQCGMIPKEIADYFGKDRTSVLYAIDTANELLANNKFFIKRVAVDEQLERDLSI